MSDQNFKNHSRYLAFYHFIVPTAILVLIVGSCINLYKACINCSSTDHVGFYNAWLICLTSFVLLILWWYCRSFALRAQDRAIRAEENLRYFAITGNLLDNKLTMRQVVALRFASNNEFVTLAHRAVEENLGPKDIKKAIQHWKEDHDRA